MKIIHIIYDSIGNPWLGGGGAQRTHEVYKRLAKKHDVIVLAGNFPSAIDTIDNVHYKRIGASANYFLSRISFLLLAYIYILFSKADIFIEDLGFPFPLLITNIKNNVLASVQFIPNESYIKKRGFLGYVIRKIFGTGLKYYHVFVTTSKYAASYINKYAQKSNVLVIPNGINFPSEKKSYNDEKYFLFLGRIDFIGKGLDTLLEATKLLKPDDIKIVIAGSGEKNESIKVKKIIKNYKIDSLVTLTGYVEGSDKEKLLKNCYALVLPSRNETFGIVALEAFSYGKPVIGTNIGGLEDLLKNSKAALTFEPGDYKSFAAQMKKLHKNETFAKELGQNGEKYAQEFTWDQIVNNYEKLLYKVVGENYEK